MDRRRFVKVATLGALSVIPAVTSLPASAETAQLDGGTKDLATGLVWSPSYYAISRSLWTWGPAQQQAAAYVAYERDEWGNVTAAYDDWRVPTVAELQMAIRNGTLGQIWNGAAFTRGRVSVWSGEDRGNRAAWAVEVHLDGAGRVLAEQSGKAVVLDKRSGLEVFFVRP